VTDLSYTPTTWAEQVLEDVNAEAPNAAPVPIDPNTVGDILHWMPAEEPPSNWFDRNNPLNASLGTSASDGTGSYPDLSTGANYTAKMINQSNMSAIRAALAADDPVGSGFSQAVVSSPWASGHYGGNPLDIAQTVASPNDPSAPASAGSPGTVPSVNLASTSAQLASLNANPFDLFGIPQTAASSLWADLGPFLAKSLLVVAGLGVIGLGLYKATDAGPKINQAAQSAGELGAVAAA
jgi:hypothetical protein